jgi:hypothetical protein
MSLPLSKKDRNCGIQRGLSADSHVLEAKIDIQLNEMVRIYVRDFTSPR